MSDRQKNLAENVPLSLELMRFADGHAGDCSDGFILRALIKTRRLLQSPSRWTKHALARKTDITCSDIPGPPCTYLDTKAVQWSLPGAIRLAACEVMCQRMAARRSHVTGEYLAAAVRWRLSFVCTSSPHTPFDPCNSAQWNDHPERTHEDVLNLLDAGIAKEKLRITELMRAWEEPIYE